MKYGTLSLYELSTKIQEALEANLPTIVWVTGEISDFKENPSGHCYLELVEKNNDSDQSRAKARATIWSRSYRKLKPFFETSTGTRLASGIKILVQCSVNYHPVYGLSLNIIDIDPTYTIGDIEHRRQETINRLIADGVFGMNKEVDFPLLPKRIAVISSSTAAGYQDFVHQLSNNPLGYAFVHKLFSATMQGDKAEQSLIDALDHIHVDLENWDIVAIIRGGGSQIDLGCFDTYQLANNIAQFPIPVVTGIGHEKDYSIADMVAHSRLKTPTAVAEFLINRFSNAENWLVEVRENFGDAVSNLTSQNSLFIQKIQMGIAPLLIKRIGSENSNLHKQILTCDAKANLLITKGSFGLYESLKWIKHSVKVNLKTEGKRLNFLGIEMQSKPIELISRYKDRVIQFEKNALAHDPVNLLRKGFSITRQNGVIVRDLSKLKTGDAIETTLAKGKLFSTIIRKNPNG
ncbi:MAG: exodeoxyribonuclease VII large subunit [Bacteroidales bacterium]|nr:exodeoxyribonuclease VII large subunit [Bacteroidales bacterium]MDD4383610.1 exodeoxyribonuclease VII large subunit [Bacteroidales bacterium]